MSRPLLEARVSSGRLMTSPLSMNGATAPVAGKELMTGSVMLTFSAAVKRSACRTWNGLEW
ncbi:hypothetical protein GTY83_32910 [Streptomyces sp. SID4928]|uniref:hypothetical protein n=1 Tax=unclassified Streptomyces TaxID=2593676 RepID=UPI0001C18DB8|nr:hypothetical protein [Streptomyces sp. ACT-1]EGE45845.1 hypothetical protein SACT1_6546 [Streptomyces sp. ACT-1]MYR53865.1 hypothetical protein [Streptomyces sp. SID4928]